MPSSGEPSDPDRNRKRWLPLRGGPSRIKLIRVNTAYRPRIVLGTIKQADEGARASSQAEHTEPRSEVATRRSDATSIKLPLPTREQTALFFEVGPDTQAKLRGMGNDGSDGRTEAAAEAVDTRSQRGAEMALEAEAKRARAAGAWGTDRGRGERAETRRARHGRIKR